MDSKISHPLFEILNDSILMDFKGPLNNHVNTSKYSGTSLVCWNRSSIYSNVPFIIEGMNKKILSINCFLATSKEIPPYGCQNGIPEVLAATVNYLYKL